MLNFHSSLWRRRSPCNMLHLPWILQRLSLTLSPHLTSPQHCSWSSCPCVPFEYPSRYWLSLFPFTTSSAPLENMSTAHLSPVSHSAPGSLVRNTVLRCPGLPSMGADPLAETLDTCPIHHRHHTLPHKLHSIYTHTHHHTVHK